MTRENSAYRYNWSKLRSNDNQILWANPPFSQLAKVVTKLCLEPSRMVLVHPDWRDEYWTPLLKSITDHRIEIKSGKPIYLSDHSKKPLPSPSWNTLVSLVDSTKYQVDSNMLDPKIKRLLQRMSKNWGLSELKHEVSKYPQNIGTFDQISDLGEGPIQTNVVEKPCLVAPNPKIKVVPQLDFSQENNEVLSPIDKCQEWIQSSSFQGPNSPDHSVEHLECLLSSVDVLTWKNNFETQFPGTILSHSQVKESSLAKYSLNFPIYSQEINNLVKNKVFHFETAR